MSILFRRSHPSTLLVELEVFGPITSFTAEAIPMISVSNVSMRYGSKVLFDDVDDDVLAGRRYGLTGPNGAGKSTFMKLLTGELPPQKGTVSAAGEARRPAPGSVRVRPVPRASTR